MARQNQALEIYRETSDQAPVICVQVPIQRWKLVAGLVYSVLLIASSVFLVCAPFVLGGVILGLCCPLGVMIAVYALVLTEFYWKRLFDPAPALTITREGLFENTSAAGRCFIGWEEILDFTITRAEGFSFLSLILRDPEDFINRSTGSARWVMRVNQKYFGTPVHISSGFLACNFVELYTLIVTAHAASIALKEPKCGGSRESRRCPQLSQPGAILKLKSKI